jgi:hypothetical protein
MDFAERDRLLRFAMKTIRMKSDTLESVPDGSFHGLNAMKIWLVRFGIATMTWLFAAGNQAHATSIVIDDTVVAPKVAIGIGVNGSGGWYGFVGANMINNCGFEGAADSNGLSQSGWPWWKSGNLTSSVDTAAFSSGKQSQKIVAEANSAIVQTRVDLPQEPLVMQTTNNGTYVIKARIKSLSGGSIQFGFVPGSWSTTYGPTIPVGTNWTTCSWTNIPNTDTLLRGFAVKFVSAGTYWVDDFICWNANDLDTTTGLSKTFVDRLKDLKPASLRLGGLGVNSIPLENYLARPWPLSYGPPPFEPEMDLDTFLTLCKSVGANPFICVPPAFSDAAHAALGDMTGDVVTNWYADHGNLVDYIGGNASTAYGARREAQGFSRWDSQFSVIYYELGNELWGTPDGKWDMNLTGSQSQNQLMENYKTYCVKRMTEMKGRPGWRANMQVGFGGFGPGTWIGGWPGSYDGTLVPAVKDLTDFSTIFMYYGLGSDTNTDEQIYGNLFATAQWHERTIKSTRAAFAAAAGRSFVTAVYEGNAVWGPYCKANDPILYGKEVSIGAAVSLVDNYAAANRAGLTVNNHFHINGNAWAALTGYPQCYRKPAFFALKLFTTYIGGNMITSTITGSPTWNDGLSGETNVPYVACYPYKDETSYYILVINRHRTQSQGVTIAKDLIPDHLVKLSSTNINDSNESGEIVTLQEEALSGVQTNSCTLSVPPFSAFLLVARDPNAAGPKGTPVSWLRQYGLTNDTPAIDELKDVDGDGVPAWKEYLAGTDPTNKSSVFIISAISKMDADRAQIIIETVSGKSYLIESCPDIRAGMWTPAQYALTNNGGMQSNSFLVNQSTAAVYVAPAASMYYRAATWR